MSGSEAENHCGFCFVEFIDPADVEAHRTYVERHPEILTKGYTTTADHPDGADYDWICPSCFEDFAEAFGWRVEVA